MKTIAIKDWVIHLAESKAICPHCERNIPFDEIESKYMKVTNHYIRLKCKCKRYVGITSNIQGDYIAFELKKIKL